jgi:hypothetical protein
LETFDPPLTEDFEDLVLRISRNEPAFNYIQAAQYKGAVNQDVFHGFDAGTVKCVVYEGKLARAAGLAYWQVNYEFHVRPDGWARRVLDSGYRIRTGTASDGTPTFEILKDDDGNPLSQPVLLDGNGARLAEWSNPVYLTYNTKAIKPFSVFGLV